MRNTMLYSMTSQMISALSIKFPNVSISNLVQLTIMTYIVLMEFQLILLHLIMTSEFFLMISLCSMIISLKIPPKQIKCLAWLRNPMNTLTLICYLSCLPHYIGIIMVKLYLGTTIYLYYNNKDKALLSQFLK